MARADGSSNAMTTTKTARPGAREIEALAAKRMVDSGEAVLVDVREPDEHARERIPGAKLMPLSAFDAAALSRDGATKVVIHCRSGRRAMEACARAVLDGRVEAVSLKGGIEGWKAAGLPVQENRRVPIGVMRQTQIAIGLIVLTGVALTALVSPWFLIIPGFMGAGLVFAGSSGFCGMASLLAMAPWNRVFRAAAESEPTGSPKTRRGAGSA